MSWTWRRQSLVLECYVQYKRIMIFYQYFKNNYLVTQKGARDKTLGFLGFLAGLYILCFDYDFICN